MVWVNETRATRTIAVILSESKISGRWVYLLCIQKVLPCLMVRVTIICEPVVVEILFLFEIHSLFVQFPDHKLFDFNNFSCINKDLDFRNMMFWVSCVQSS